jgi:hypothetical protein
LDLKTLQARISKEKDDIVACDIRSSQNWRSGYWSVRGFSIDKYDPIANMPGIHTSGDLLQQQQKKGGDD